MGKLVDGHWTTDDSSMRDQEGAFVRAQTRFRDWVPRDGSSGYKAEVGRYHLYVSTACPWAHRTMIVRQLKQLEDAISLSIVDPHMGEDGWHFSTEPGCIPDTVNGFSLLRELYLAADPAATTRVSVPVLWDKETGAIVNNESSEIIRMFNSAFDDIADANIDFYPEDLHPEIDTINPLVFDHINNGVYKCGFAGSQLAHKRAFHELFGALDVVEERLGQQRYLAGNRWGGRPSRRHRDVPGWRCC